VSEVGKEKPHFARYTLPRPCSTALVMPNLCLRLDTNNAFQHIGLTEANLALDLAQSRYDLGLSSIVELGQAQLNKTSDGIGSSRVREAPGPTSHVCGVILIPWWNRAVIQRFCSVGTFSAGTFVSRSGIVRSNFAS
jgi:hypothetical protein